MFLYLLFLCRNLAGNNLKGPIPPQLLEKSKRGTLSLRYHRLSANLFVNLNHKIVKLFVFYCFVALTEVLMEIQASAHQSHVTAQLRRRRKLL